MSGEDALRESSAEWHLEKDAKMFNGRWVDDRNNRITVDVTKTHQDDNDNQIIFVHIEKIEGQSMCLTIKFDEARKEWLCGNGVLLRKRCNANILVWLAPTGLASAWTRRPEEKPESLQFYDALIPGVWLDNFGHQVVVEPIPPQPDTGTCTVSAFTVQMQQPGKSVKVFKMQKDQTENEWRCGKGILVRHMCNSGTLVWLVSSCSASTWTRCWPCPVASEPCPVTDEVFVPEDNAPTLSEGSYVEWLVKEPWEWLAGLPKGCCVSSPHFKVSDTASFNFELYPNAIAQSDGYSNCSVGLVIHANEQLNLNYEIYLNGEKQLLNLHLAERHNVSIAPKPVFKHRDVKRVFIGMKIRSSLAD